MTKIILSALLVLLLTIAPALLHGKFTHRWGEPADLTAAAGKLDDFPTQVGDWKYTTDNEPLSEGVMTELGLVKSISRNYVNDQTGEQVGLLIMLGEPGRLVRHPPYICYANRANQQVGDMQSLEVTEGDQSHMLNLLRYKRANSPLGDEFLVAYGFTTDGNWDSPSSPRMKYGGGSLLYKIQVLMVSKDEESAKSVQDFVSAFVKTFPEILVNEQ